MLTKRRSTRQTPTAGRRAATAALPGPAPGSPAAVLASGKVNGLRMRPHRPLRALAGALLVVTAVVAALAIYTSLGDRTEVLAARRTILAGQQVTSADVQVVSISTDDDIPTIAAAQRPLIVGQYARVRVAQGSLLVAESVQSEPLVTPDRVLMSVEVPVGQVPVGLREQSRVVLVVQPGGTARSGDAAPVLVDAVVAAIPRNLADVVGTGGSTMLSLSVEVPSSHVALVGAAEAVSVGVLDPEAAFPGTQVGAPVDDGAPATSASGAASISVAPLASTPAGGG